MFLEERRYPPPEGFAAQANAQPAIYDEGFEAFWEREGRERVSWFEPFSELLEWQPPYAKWYLGGKLNIAYNCLDRHVENGLGDKVAYHWEGEPVDDRRSLTFSDLQREVVKCANALKALGVRKGTPVGIYMGMVPEAPVAMLACARLGAPHTVVFGGFSADSLSDRLQDMGCEVLITQDEAWRRGTTVPLKLTADEAVAASPKVGHVLVLRRTGGDVPMTAGRDVWWHDVVTDESECPPEPMDSEDLLYLLYTLGHDREAEGDRAHDGRLPRRRRDDAPLHLRHQARLGLLVRGRHRLGHGPQLHRLRPALQRHHERHVRGNTRLPRQGSLVADHRALQGRHPLHRADGDPHSHEVGAGVRGPARPLVATPPRLGRRADQSRGVGLVPRAHRRRPLPDRRHLVADRDGDDHDHAASRCDDAQAGLRDETFSGHRRRRSTTRRARRSDRAAAATSC